MPKRPDFAPVSRQHCLRTGLRFRKLKIMKTPLFLGLALLAALSTPAWAADLRTITMSGHGEMRAVPDQVQINAGVTSSAATAAAALPANTARMKGPRRASPARLRSRFRLPIRISYQDPHAIDCATGS